MGGQGTLKNDAKQLLQFGGKRIECGSGIKFEGGEGKGGKDHLFRPNLRRKPLGWSKKTLLDHTATFLLIRMKRWLEVPWGSRGLNRWASKEKELSPAS